MCKLALSSHIVYHFSFIGASPTFHSLHLLTMPRTKHNHELEQALQLYNNAIVTNHPFVNGITTPLFFSPVTSPNFGVNQNIPGIGLGLDVQSPPPYQNHFSHTNQIDSVNINFNASVTDNSCNLNSITFPNVGIEKPTGHNDGSSAATIPVNPAYTAKFSIIIITLVFVTPTLEMLVTWTPTYFLFLGINNRVLINPIKWCFKYMQWINTCNIFWLQSNGSQNPFLID